MRFYWIRDRVRQGQFLVYWRKGSLNKADYFTKHHPASHHQDIRSAYLYSPDARAKNYFDCLQDDSPEISTDIGEGVLSDRDPGTNDPTSVRHFDSHIRDSDRSMRAHT